MYISIYLYANPLQTQLGNRRKHSTLLPFPFKIVCCCAGVLLLLLCDRWALPVVDKGSIHLHNASWHSEVSYTAAC